MLLKIYRIKDFYDKNVNDIKARRYRNGRKIHERKTNSELEKNEVCPYDGCDKTYACEGSLNLHIKTKHNGGNKTDRERLAKALVIRKTKGYVIPDKLDVNLPPCIVQKAAEQIQQLNNIKIDHNDLKFLEKKLQEHNRINEERMKREALKKAEEDTERANQMVEAK